MSRATKLQGQTIAELGEFSLIDRVAAILPDRDARVVLGIGDDTAAFRTRSDRLLLATCDIQVEGRHFVRSRISAHHLGRRAAAINLSDIASMGGEPTFALVSLALPEATEVEWVEDLYRGLRAELTRYDASVIGGNMSGAKDDAIIDLTLLGEVDEATVLTRGGASPGDVILVTGALGASILGRLALDRGLDAARPGVVSAIEAHLTPTPRVEEGRAIGRSRKATAMIDVSDGLASDLSHVCERSGAGARLVAERLPVASAVRALAADLGADPILAALHGGEDYELIVTCAPGDADALSRWVADATGTPLTQVGEITAEPGMTLVAADGQEQPLEPQGWDHFAREGPA